MRTMLALWLGAFCWIHADEAAKPRIVRVLEKQPIRHQSKDLLFKGEFDELTKIAKRYRGPGEVLPDGSWKLDYFYQGFGNCSDMNEWARMFERLEEWNAHEKDDPAPVVATGNAFWSFGKQARGRGFANTVTPEGWELLQQRLKAGREKLAAEPNRVASCPGYFVVMMKIGVDASLPRPEFMKAFEEGTKLAPDYLTLHEMKSYYILPRWHGKRGELREFVLDLAENQPAAALWVLWRLEFQGVYQNVFEKEGIEWEVVRDHLAPAVDGSNLAQSNMFAYLADVAGDLDTVRTVLAAVDYQLDGTRWRHAGRMDEIVAGALEPK